MIVNWAKFIGVNNRTEFEQLAFPGMVIGILSSRYTFRGFDSRCSFKNPISTSGSCKNCKGRLLLSSLVAKDKEKIVLNICYTMRQSGILISPIKVPEHNRDFFKEEFEFFA